MFKTNNFTWTTQAETTFTHLKTAITTTPVLALPDFDKEFTIETDASGLGIVAVLTQKTHLVAFLSKAFSYKHQSLYVYDKEMFVILYSVDKWRHYIFGRPFTILTYRQTLKNLLDQRISTPSQKNGFRNLWGTTTRSNTVLAISILFQTHFHELHNFAPSLPFWHPYSTV